MNYNRYENEQSVIAKTIFEYKFKQESLEVYIGANTKENLTYAKWEKRCKDLLNTFFSRDSISSGVILFPDVDIALHRQVCQIETWERVMNTLNAWCKWLSPNDATGLIIRNYDIKNHFGFRQIKEDEIQEKLTFKNSKSMFSFQESDKRFLVFNPSLQVIIIIRLVELLEGELKLLKKEVDYCIDEVNFLCFLLKDVLENTGVIVTGLVVYLGENAHIQSGCEDCHNIVVPFAIFKSAETFNIFWKHFAKTNSFEDLEIIERKDKTNSFQSVASKILGYLAHLQFVMFEEPMLPVKKYSATSNIEQAELLLDRYQMEIAYSNDKRLWLQGNYGTGKTIVALKKLELLLKSLKDREVIYYVNYAMKSRLDFVIKQKFKNQENVKAIRGGFSLSTILRTQILPKERDIGTRGIHLIVDEYRSEDLSTDEAKSLGQILREEAKFKESTVLIAAQPITIDRVDKFYDKNVVKKEFSERKHELDKLIQITGMKVRTLNNVMRTTVQINNLIQTTQQYLNNKSNQYVHKGNPPTMKNRVQKSLSNLTKKAGSVLSSSLRRFSSDSSKHVTNISPCEFKKVNDHLYEKKFNTNSSNLNSKPSSSVSANSGDSSNPVISNPPLKPQKIIHVDELFSLMQPETSVKESNYQETLIKYTYPCNSRIGHNITGPLPQLIKLEESADDFEQVALIVAVLDKIIKPADTKSKRTVVIHFEPNDPPPWLWSLFETEKYFSNLTMTVDLEKFLIDTSENLVLVKNLSFLKGLEFSNVLLILESNQHYQRQFIPEAIARCRSNLSILIKPSRHGIHKSDTVADLANIWESGANWGNSAVSILKIGFCCEPFCKGEADYCENQLRTSYGVHKNSKYMFSLKKIQDTYAYVQNIQQDDVQAAKAL